MIQSQRPNAFKEALLPHAPIDRFLLVIGTVWLVLYAAFMLARWVLYIIPPPEDGAIPPFLQFGCLTTNMVLLAAGYTPVLLCAACRPQHRHLYLRAILFNFVVLLTGATIVWLLLNSFMFMGVVN